MAFKASNLTLHLASLIADFKFGNATVIPSDSIFYRYFPVAYVTPIRTSTLSSFYISANKGSIFVKAISLDNTEAIFPMIYVIPALTVEVPSLASEMI